MANSVDPDQTLHSVASDLGIHSLLRPVVPIYRIITVYNFSCKNKFICNVRKRIFRHVHPAEIQTSQYICADWAEPQWTHFWVAKDAKLLHTDNTLIRCACRFEALMGAVSEGFFIAMGFNDMLTLVGHFVSSPRERKKRDRRDSRGDEREGQGRKRNRNESEETEEIKTFPQYPYLLQQ